MAMRTYEEVRSAFLNRHSHVPAEFRNVTLADFRRHYSPEGHDAVEEYIHDIHGNLSRGDGLLLVGPPGRGKTMLACIALNAALAANYAAQFQTLAGFTKSKQAHIQASQLLTHSIDALEDIQRLDEQFEKLESWYPLVVLDDAEKEYRKTSGYAVAEFDHLLRTRYSNGLATIMTSNAPHKEWRTLYSESMASYVQQACRIVSVTGDDFRARPRRLTRAEG